MTPPSVAEMFPRPCRLLLSSSSVAVLAAFCFLATAASASSADLSKEQGGGSDAFLLKP